MRSTNRNRTGRPRTSPRCRTSREGLRAPVLGVQLGLEALHNELRGLPAPAGATTDLAAVRERRAAIHAEIGRLEKALEEAAAVLDELAGKPQRVAS